MNEKRGFTLVEIIICISLLAIVGVSSVVGLNLVNNNINDKKLENIENKIYEAASIYIETNKEANQQLYTNNNGVFVPLTVLENEGLIEFDDIDIEGEYVVTFLGGATPTDKCVGATTIGSWSKGDHTIYICTESTFKEEIKEDLKEEILQELGQDSNVLKDAILINAKKADGTTARSVYDENNIITTDTINTLSKIGDEYVFENNTIDNFVNFNNMCFRATRIQEDGSIKLLLQDKDSTCNEADYSGAWSIGQGHFGYTYNDYSGTDNSFSKGDYLNGKTDTTNSMKYKLDIWFNTNFSDKLEYLKENNWTIEDVSSTVYYKSDFYGDVIKTETNFTDIFNTYYNDYAFYEHTTSFTSYVATIRSEEYHSYMSDGGLSYWLLNIGGIGMSPNGFGRSAVTAAKYIKDDKISVGLGELCKNSLPIRPMIVLKDGVKISGGVGTQINPYVIEE